MRRRNLRKYSKLFKVIKIIVSIIYSTFFRIWPLGEFKKCTPKKCSIFYWVNGIKIENIWNKIFEISSHLSYQMFVHEKPTVLKMLEICQFIIYSTWKWKQYDTYKSYLNIIFFIQNLFNLKMHTICFVESLIWLFLFIYFEN